jgi:hypothetical protein
MLRRILVATVLAAGLLSLISAGRPPVGRAAAAPRPVRAAWLYGVSATSATNVWAVGAFGHADGAAPLIEHGNGRQWKPVATATNIPENVDSFFGVAATSATSAWTAGEISSQYAFPLADRWNGHRWTRSGTPTPGGDGGAAGLAGVGAASSTDAWAVGSYYPDLAAETLILRWTGQDWIQVRSPNPAGTGSTARNFLQGVAVLSPASAWAVGDASTGLAGAPVTTAIEHWNGTAWATVASPDPAGCASSELLGVAARPTGTWAVGSSCGAPLVLRLTGGRWRQVATPEPPSGTSEQLSSVAVTSATNAWAVGHAGRRILVLRWNGTRWATVSAPSPAGATSAVLAGVTAVSPSVAWAVGQANYGNGVTKLLIERWTGTKWKLASVSNPPS